MAKIRLKDCFRNRGQNISDSFKGNILYVDIGNVSYEHGILNKVDIDFNDAPSRARKRVMHNDIILSTVRTYLKSIVRIDSPEPNLIVSTGFAVLKPKPNFSPTFLEYVLKNDMLQNLIAQNSSGVSYPAINTEVLLAIGIECPLFSEQQTIANYLDTQTTRINRKISILEQKFEKLDEYKQSVIFEVVTKGLDSHVPMKDSGIEWIGEIPSHWHVFRLKDAAIIKKGEVFDDTTAVENGLYPYINGGINPSDWSNIFNAYENTIAVSEGGASAGYTQFMKTRYWAGSHCYKIQSKNPTADSKYVYYVLKGFEKNLMSEKTGSAMPNLQKTRFINYVVSFVTNLDEQTSIVLYLDTTCSTIDKQKSLIKKKIALLKEYKQAVIYEAVTGKLEL